MSARQGEEGLQGCCAECGHVNVPMMLLLPHDKVGSRGRGAGEQGTTHVEMISLSSRCLGKESQQDAAYRRLRRASATSLRASFNERGLQASGFWFRLPDVACANLQLIRVPWRFLHPIQLHFGRAHSSDACVGPAVLGIDRPASCSGGGGRRVAHTNVVSRFPSAIS